jgi:hypothetical protein
LINDVLLVAQNGHAVVTRECPLSGRYCCKSRFAQVIKNSVHEAVEGLVETRAVIEETLRVYPPIIAITRTAVRPTKIAGYPIKRGTLVVVSPYVLHRHRCYGAIPICSIRPVSFLALVRKYNAFRIPRSASGLACVSARYWRCRRQRLRSPRLSGVSPWN